MQSYPRTHNPDIATHYRASISPMVLEAVMQNHSVTAAGHYSPTLTGYGPDDATLSERDLNYASEESTTNLRIPMRKRLSCLRGRSDAVSDRYVRGQNGCISKRDRPCCPAVILSSDLRAALYVPIATCLYARG